MYVVYQHTNKTNGKIYIGITNNIKIRWADNEIHYKPYGEKKERPFWNAICKYGWDNFEHAVLIDGLTFEEACVEEKRLIAEQHANERGVGYNVAEGGNGGHV